MSKYYNADILLEFVKQYTPHIDGETTMQCVETAILNAPTVDVVSRNVYEQVKWERDTAIEQLKSYGVGLGEKADVVKVKHDEM